MCSVILKNMYKFKVKSYIYLVETFRTSRLGTIISSNLRKLLREGEQGLGDVGIQRIATKAGSQEHQKMVVNERKLIYLKSRNLALLYV